jgi:hypothetical protein
MGDGLIEDSTDALHRSASVRCKGRAAPVRAGCGLATGTSDGLAAVRAEGRSSDATVGVNQWPRSQPVLTCSTGPSLDPQVQRSTIWAGAVQAGSGQGKL